MQYHKIELNELPICEYCSFFEVTTDVLFGDDAPVHNVAACRYYDICSRAMGKTAEIIEKQKEELNE